MPVMLGWGGYFALGPTWVTDFILVGGCNESDLFSRLLVGRLDFVPGTAGREEIPTEATVTDRALEDKHGFIQSITELVSDPGLYADLAAGYGQPVVTPNATATSRPAAALSVHVAHVIAGRPVTGVIDHEGVELLVLDRMLKGAFLIPLDSTHFEGVRLAHDYEDLYLARFG